MAQGSKRRVRVVVALGVICLGGLATAGAVMVPVRGAVPVVADARPAQPVRVAPIDFAPAERVLTYTGTIRPRHEVAMGFRIAGKVVARAVEVGDPVRKGQVLARLDDTDARLQEELAAAEAGAADVDRHRAAADLQRAQRLFDEGHVAQAVLDRAVSAEAEAAARADRAGRALRLARNALAYTRLEAEADGVVTATPGEVGQVVGAGVPVVSVAQAGAVDVVFALPEKDRDMLVQGTAVGTVWGDEGVGHALRLRDISPDVDPAGRTYRVRMTMGAADVAFGRTVTVRVVAGTEAPVAAVPLAAVLDDGAGPGVWRIRGDRVERVAVTVVSVSGEAATIRGGLTEGDTVVSLGAHKVDPARPVRVVEIRAVAEE